MITKLEYNKWKTKQLEEDNPDLRCLENLVLNINQYLNNPLHKPCLTVLKNAIKCSELWISERNDEIII